MGMLTLLRHPRMLVSLLFRVFLPWYCLEAPLWILKNYVKYAKAWMEILSFPYLLRTLVAPWKNIADSYPKNALNIQLVLEALTLNLTARAVGFVIRLAAFIVGITIQCVLIVGFATFLLLWLTFPLLLPFGIAAILYSLGTF